MEQTELNPKKVTNLVPLNSIGSMLDSTNGLIYPMNTDGTADMHEGTATDVRDIGLKAEHCPLALRHLHVEQLSNKDFNSIMASILHVVEQEVHEDILNQNK